MCWLLVLLCGGVLSGCSSRPKQPRTLATKVKSLHLPKDDWGREVNLQKPAERVVCIGPGATETIFALGVEKKLVGRDQISDYPAATIGIPIVGDYTGPFIEKTIAVKPDLVIVQGETYDKTRADNWQQKIGVPVAVLVPTSVYKVAAGIRKLSKWLGNERQADTLARNLLRRRGRSFQVGTFFEVQRSPLWTAGKGTLIDDVLFRAGFSNRGASDGYNRLSGYKQFNIESLLAMKPNSLESYIVPMAKPDRSKALQGLNLHPRLSQLGCIRKGYVVVIASDLVLRPGPRLASGIDELRKEAHELYRARPIVKDQWEG